MDLTEYTNYIKHVEVTVGRVKNRKKIIAKNNNYALAA